MLELSKVAGNDIEINYISIYPQGMARKGNFEKSSIYTKKHKYKDCKKFFKHIHLLFFI